MSREDAYYEDAPHLQVLQYPWVDLVTSMCEKVGLGGQLDVTTVGATLRISHHVLSISHQNPDDLRG